MKNLVASTVSYNRAERDDALAEADAWEEAHRADEALVLSTQSEPGVWSAERTVAKHAAVAAALAEGAQRTPAFARAQVVTLARQALELAWTSLHAWRTEAGEDLDHCSAVALAIEETGEALARVDHALRALGLAKTEAPLVRRAA